MEYVSLGKTGLLASRIGLGCEILGGTDWGNVDPDQAVLAVHRAMDVGINVFDTADVYGLGKSEEALSHALGDRRHDMVIVSKCGVNWRVSSKGQRAATFRDCSPDHIRFSVEASLRRLRIESIPVYLLHWPDPKTPIEESVDALLQCKKDGKIRSFGFSNFCLDSLIRVRDMVDTAVVEVPYSLLERSAGADVIPYAHQSGWGVLCYGVLAQGLLTGKYSNESEFSESDRRHRLTHFAADAWSTNDRVLSGLRKLALNKKAEISQVAISWVLSHPGVSVALVGGRTQGQVERNAAAVDVPLGQHDLSVLLHAREASDP